jgi:hypothetical protein
MKHSTIYFLILLICSLLNSVRSQAENPSYPFVSMNIQATPVANDTSNGIPDLSDSTIFHIDMNVSLFDTTNIDQIYVVLSDSGNAGNRLTHTFDWDVTGDTGNGTSYVRSEYNLLLSLGNFKDLLNFTATVRIKRADNTFTDYITFSR